MDSKTGCVRPGMAGIWIDPSSILTTRAKEIGQTVIAAHCVYQSMRFPARFGLGLLWPLPL